MSIETHCTLGLSFLHAKIFFDCHWGGIAIILPQREIPHPISNFSFSGGVAPIFIFGVTLYFWDISIFFSKNEAKNQQSLQLKWIYRYWGPSVPKIIFIGGIFDLALIWQKIAPLPLKLKKDIRVSGLWPHFLTKMVLTLQALLNMVH